MTDIGYCNHSVTVLKTFRDHIDWLKKRTDKIYLNFKSCLIGKRTRNLHLKDSWTGFQLIQFIYENDV